MVRTMFPKAFGIAALAAFGASGAALAHDVGARGGYQPDDWQYGCCQGLMMGPGHMMGYGHMMGPAQMPGYGQRVDPGQMPGYGHMGGGGHMMGPGYEGQRGAGPGMMQPLREDLDADDVRHMIGHRLEWMNNPNVKLGRVEEKDADTIVADIVTQDGSLVQRLRVDRHTGWMQPGQ